jgi:BlaI family transcriptional regulator, penicillinase repressor
MTSKRSKQPTPKVTGAELAVLDALWRQGRLSIRQIADEIYRGGKASEYATVQKLLERLEAKDCVARDRSSFAHVFEARIERADLIDQELAEVADKLCDGSLTPLLTHLVAKRKLTREEREMLRRLLDDR